MNKNEAKTDGLRVVVKFFTNVQNRTGDGRIQNQLITRTLGKLGVVDSKWRPSSGKYPQDGEFWLTRIVREVSPGRPQGVFVLEPLHQVDADEINRLAPGMYDEDSRGGTVIVTPSLREDMYWLMPLSLRKAMAGANAVIVRYVGYEEPKEPLD